MVGVQVCDSEEANPFHMIRGWKLLRYYGGSINLGVLNALNLVNGGPK
jgi:hypothetical protein